MKTLLNIETFGIRLYYIEPIDCDLLLEYRDAYIKGLYVFEYDDTEVPAEYQHHYQTLDEALGEIERILNDAFKYDTVGEYGEDTYRYGLYSMQTLHEPDSHYHYVNARLTFETLNV